VRRCHAVDLDGLDVDYPTAFAEDFDLYAGALVQPHVPATKWCRDRANDRPPVVEAHVGYAVC